MIACLIFVFRPSAMSAEEKEKAALEKLKKFQSGMRGAKGDSDDWRSQPLNFPKEDEEAFKQRMEAEAATLAVFDEREARGSDRDRGSGMNEHERTLRTKKNTEKW